MLRKLQTKSTFRGRRRVRFETLESRQLLAGSFSIGTNLPPITDFTATAFVDIVNQSRVWQTRNVDPSFLYAAGVFSTGFQNQIPIDANGWPLVSPFTPSGGVPQVVHTVMPVHGAGTYQLFFEGTGQLTFRANEGLLNPDSPFQANRTVTLSVGGGVIPFEIFDSEFGDGNGELFVYLDQSDATDPIRNLRLIPPSSVQPVGASSFRSSFTDELSNFSNLRFMDWMSTNNNPIVNWTDRVTLNSYTQAQPVGVAVEYITELANEIGKDAWITIPAAASDDFITSLAVHLRDHLNPNLKVFVEYSNETWNGMFNQSAFVQTEGKKIWPTLSNFRAGTKFHAMRSATAWKIFEDTFTTDSPDRLIKVMATQSANVGVSELRMEALLESDVNPTGIMPDALAIGAYFGSSIADDLATDAPTGTDIEPDFVTEIIDRLHADLDLKTTADVAAQRAVADAYDLWLITYEGGQHLAATTSANRSNQSLTNHLIEANRDDRMYDLYRDYLDMLNDADVALHSNFTYIYRPNSFGSWGLQENQDQPLSDAPKFQAILDWADDNPVVNRLAKIRVSDDVAVIDDGDGIETITLDASATRDFDGRIVQFTWTVDGQVIGTDPTLTLDFPVGASVVTVSVTDNDGGVQTDQVAVIVSPVTASSVLLQTDFSGHAPANAVWDQFSLLNPQVQYTGWTLGGGLQATSAPDLLGFIADYGPDETTLADAIEDDFYFGFTIDSGAIESGQWLDLTLVPVEFTLRRDSFFAARTYTVMASRDGFATSELLFQTERIESQESETFSFILPLETAYTGDAIEFRIYASGGQYSAKVTHFESFRLNGVVRPSPGPRDIVLNEGGIFENADTKADRFLMTTLSSPHPTGETTTFSLVDGDGDDDNELFEVIGDQLYLRQGVSLDHETSELLRVRLRSTDPQGIVLERGLEIAVRDLAEVVQVSVNDGAIQRSRVDSLTITFEGEVSVASDAFLIRNRATGAAVSYQVASPVFANGATTVRLTFSGVESSLGSLNDGNYELTILADRVFSQDGFGLDSNRDGIAGDDDAFGDVESDNFFRLYGDSTGNRFLNSRDFRDFRTTYGVLSTSVLFNASFDFDGNNIINGRDFRQFVRRYGVPLVF